MHIADMKFSPSPLNASIEIVDAVRGLVIARPQRRKVALVAAGVYREEAPYLDAEWEIWALNAVPPKDPLGRLRADRWFEMHERKAQSVDDMRWIESCPCPIYLPPAWAEQVFANRSNTGHALLTNDIPHAIRYPLEAAEHAYGPYWACTFAYQMALAIMEGFTDIGLYGVELAYGTARERTLELACVSWWLGLAEGRGIKIHLPSRSMLGRHRYRYGIEYSEEKKWVEQYVDFIRAADRARGVDESKPYDSADDDFVHGQGAAKA